MLESRSRLIGAVMVMGAAIAFSGKAIIIKFAYRHQVDPVTLLTLRMLMSATFFLILGWWASRGADVKSLQPTIQLAGAGLVMAGVLARPAAPGTLRQSAIISGFHA